jgi:ABC-type molybdate transport system substrate-binding protein
MVTTPRVNWVLFVLYSLVAISMTVAALVSPAFRAQAPAPLRDVILPAPKPVILNVLYSTEKDAWLAEVVAAFEASQVLVDGHPVQVEMEKMGSREMVLAVLDGTNRPDIISPASMLQIAILQDQSTAAFGAPLVNMADEELCPSVVTTPLVLVAWEERAQALWGNHPGEDFWRDFQTALVDPAGWSAFGHPEWGYVKFGHTDPLRSNSGFMTILLMTYDFHDRTSGLSAADITADPEYQSWFLDFERSISQFEYSTGPLMEKMIAYGPSTYDIAAVYEATAIEQAENATGRYGDLRIYYPPVTVWSDHPFCILNADWVTPEKNQAARLFLDYLQSPEVQQLALLRYGFRPTDPAIPLDQPGSPFNVYAPNGLQRDLSGLPSLQPTSGDVLNILLEFWSRNVAR